MRLAMLAIAAVGIGGYTAYDQYDKSTNFVPVDVRISAVKEECYLEKVDRGILSKTTSTSGMLLCPVAEILTREHPKWQGYEIKHKIDVSFAYISPVDRATHTASHRMTAFPNGKTLRAGDMLPILVSKTKPDKTRQA
jgi:hypothetical protein